jgi:glutamate-ammonia-ligase adenylyltransferase
MKFTPEFYGIEEYSRFARRLIEADPSLQREALGEGRASGPWTAAEMEAFIAAGPAGDEAALGATLRRLRGRVMLRTLARDLAGEATLEEVCRTMTALAEAALRHGQALLEALLAAELGTPHGEDGAPQQLIVVGMGKLGGGELNVSSDIDLVFVYPAEGDTRGGPRSVSNHEFFALLGRRLIALLDKPTGDGRVFRVDMRLRPWGDAGPLAASFDALENYLVAQGREWERYAWIKGRALTGARHAELDAIVRPFVYRKYLDYGTFAAMRELHAEVRAEVARRELADHVKLGPGGIREIEFIAQAFQLIRGGREAELRTRPTLAVLELLAGKRVISAGAEGELGEAYVFLRRLEHRLQYLDDAQTHSLPEDAGDRVRVAGAMGFADWTRFREALDLHRARVSRHFERVFSTQETPRHALAPLWQAPEAQEAAERLSALGFADAPGVAARLAALRRGARYAELPEASRMRLDSLVPDLIEQAAARPAPDSALERSLDLVEAIARRAAYLALLEEHPQALSKVVDLVSASPWAAEYLVRHPIVLDELLDPRALEEASDSPAFRNRLLRQLTDSRDDPERQMDLLREAHHAQVFRLLARDITGTLTVERLADELAELADCMLQVTLEVCWTQLMSSAPGERFPQYKGRKPRFAVIGYGKLGGKELGYASDLDIIFLYDDPDEHAAEIYPRLAQRINSWLTQRTAAGLLFETDLRLRPEGSSGLMVSSMEAFRKYQRESAWTWEHQALTRARFCAGDATTGALFEEERRAVLRLPRDPARLRAEILDMRGKLLDGHPNSTDFFDIKHDRGGMIDVEFIVQYLVLAHAHRHPELTANDGNIALLKYAADLGLIERGAADAVRDAYRRYRRRQHALRLAGERYARVPPAELAADVRATLALWAAVFET